MSLPLSCVLSPPFILSHIWCLGKDKKQRNKSSPTLFSSAEGLMILPAPLLSLFFLQFLFVLHLPLNSLILLLHSCFCSHTVALPSAWKPTPPLSLLHPVFHGSDLRSQVTALEDTPWQPRECSPSHFLPHL